MLLVSWAAAYEPDYHREVQAADAAQTVHMKDRASGAQGFLPFVSSLLHGGEQS
jgi:hypothetical protein